MLFEKKLEIPVLFSTVLVVALAVADLVGVSWVFQNAPKYQSLVVESGMLGMKAFALFISGICIAIIWPFKAVTKNELRNDAVWVQANYQILRNRAWQVRGVNNGILLWEQEYWGKACEPVFSDTWLGALAERRWQLNRLEAAMAHFREHGFDLVEPKWREHKYGSVRINSNYHTLDFTS